MMIALMTICKPEIISLDEFYSKIGNVEGGIWGAKTNYGSHGHMVYSQQRYDI